MRPRAAPERCKPTRQAAIRRFMTGRDQTELTAILAIEQAFADHIASGGLDTDTARARITGGAQGVHWRRTWERARGDQQRKGDP